jgi:iron(III) transport system substrate-binding protein
MTLSACGKPASTPDTTGIDFNSLTVEQLYEEAKKEGKVVVNSGASAEDLAIIAEAFNRLYPGIEIEHLEMQGEDSAAKLAAEAQAGVYNTDLLDTEQNTAYAIGDAGMLAEYSPPAAAAFDDQLKFPYFTGYRVQIKVISYNTDKVPAADAPKDYDDLLLPKFKDRVCVEESEVSTFADMIEDWGREKALDYWTKLTANGLRFVKGQQNLVQSVVAGECDISVAANVHTISSQMDKGAPINWVKTDPLYGNFGAVGVTAHAPHPYAARLWINYLLSNEGQQSVVNNWRIPANPAVEPRQPELKQGTFNMILAGSEVMENFTDYNNLWYTTTGRPIVGG